MKFKFLTAVTMKDSVLCYMMINVLLGICQQFEETHFPHLMYIRYPEDGESTFLRNVC